MKQTKDNYVEVWLNIYNKATYNHKYKPIKVSDKARTCIKPKSMKKGNDSPWSKEIFGNHISNIISI